MYASGDRIEKWPIEVVITLDDGAQLFGYLFMRQAARISDLLNDDRIFLPLRQLDGRIILLRKVAINQVIEVDQSVDIDTIVDPYEILGVSRDINDLELKETFRQLCLQNHPDRLVALNVAPEILELANRRLTRIIAAHQLIAKMRNLDASDLEKKAAEYHS